MDVARNSDTVIPIRDKVRVAGFDANVPRVPDRKIRQRPHFRRRPLASPVERLRSARVGSLRARPLIDPSIVGPRPRPKLPQTARVVPHPAPKVSHPPPSAYRPG